MARHQSKIPATASGSPSTRASRPTGRGKIQLQQLRTWCGRMDHEIVREYVEHESGTKGADRRPQYARLFVEAARREFDMVLVWALDRFSRTGLTSTVVDLERLSSHGVGFHSYSEPHLSTDNELVRDVLLAVLASLAKLERQKIGERTKAGLERARAKGKRLGRAPFSVLNRENGRLGSDPAGASRTHRRPPLSLRGP